MEMNQQKIPTQEDVIAQIARIKEQNKVNAFQQALDQSKNALNQQREQMAPVFAQQRTQVGVDDTMNRQAALNNATMRGLSGSGAMNQANIAQNMATSNRYGGIESQRLESERNIQSGLSKAEQDYQFAVANAKSQTELETAIQQLELSRQNEQRAREDALRAQEIARQDSLRKQEWDRQDVLRGQDYQQQMEQQRYNEAVRNNQIQQGQADEMKARQYAEQQKDIAQSRQDELNTLGAYSNDYQAEINRRQATPDTSDDWLVPYLQTARQGKIASNEQSSREQRAQAEKLAYERELKRLELELAAQKLQKEDAYRQQQLKISQQKANTASQKAISNTKPKATGKSVFDQ